MTAQEKAKEIFEKLSISRHNEISGYYIDVVETKENCIYLVDQILNAFENMILSHKTDEQYWKEVRENILKIEV